jgi:hypothetical protein
MDLRTDLIFGGLLVAFGTYSIFARIFAPHRLGKLEPMKDKWGKTGGSVMHVVAYTLLPLVAGGLMIFNELAK